MNLESLSIRSARESDGSDLFPLVVEFATSFVPERGFFEGAFRRVLADPNACLLVAELDHKVIGYLLGFDHFTFFANGPASWVEELAVTASLRRNGVGRALMARFERWAISRGSRLIALATRRAAAFYSALGYEESASYFWRLL